MKTVVWEQLDQVEQDSVLVRPAISNSVTIKNIVSDVINQVQTSGDTALLALTEKLDSVKLASLKVSSSDVLAACQRVKPETQEAIKQARQNIHVFHQAQQQDVIKVETMPGVVCEMHIAPIDAVGLYIPGGSAPLPSTVLMLATPANIAGCERIVLASPPPIADEILYTANLCGVTEIYSIGGAQAVAALAYGSESIKSVDKIFGPGNAFVTEAKRQVSMDMKGAAIDMPAGPSEVLVLADDKASAKFIAADLLSQAEHGPDSQTVLVTTSQELATHVGIEVKAQLAVLPRKEIAEKAIEHSLIIVTDTIDSAIEISNTYAPEHLIVQTEFPRDVLPKLKHAGSIFLGAWTPESVGDYASGTNHVLPTYSCTKTYSSLGLADFTKRFTVQEVTQDGLKKLAPTVTCLANAESLTAHERAVTIRMSSMEVSS